MIDVEKSFVFVFRSMKLSTDLELVSFALSDENVIVIVSASKHDDITPDECAVAAINLLQEFMQEFIKDTTGNTVN